MIFISAGHYPERPGACFGNFCEHFEASVWAKLIVVNLNDNGCKALLVPEGTLKVKAEYINSNEPVLAVEVHFNSFKVWEDAVKTGLITEDELHDTGSGSEVLYYPESQKGAILASNIQKALVEIFPPARGIKEGWYRMNPENGPDYFLQKTNCPAAIVEPEFIHRKHEIRANRREACAAIGAAIIKTRGEICP